MKAVIAFAVAYTHVMDLDLKSWNALEEKIDLGL